MTQATGSQQPKLEEVVIEDIKHYSLKGNRKHKEDKRNIKSRIEIRRRVLINSYPLQQLMKKSLHPMLSSLFTADMVMEHVVEEKKSKPAIKKINKLLATIEHYVVTNQSIMDDLKQKHPDVAEVEYEHSNPIIFNILVTCSSSMRLVNLLQDMDRLFTDIDLLRIFNKLDKKHGDDAISGLYVFVIQSLREIQSIVKTIMTDHYQNAASKERQAMMNVSSAMPLDKKIQKQAKSTANKAKQQDKEQSEFYRKEIHAEKKPPAEVQKSQQRQKEQWQKKRRQQDEHLKKQSLNA